MGRGMEVTTTKAIQNRMINRKERKERKGNNKKFPNLASWRLGAR